MAGKRSGNSFQATLEFWKASPVIVANSPSTPKIHQQARLKIGSGAFTRSGYPLGPRTGNRNGLLSYS